jgi:hypothetical protein
VILLLGFLFGYTLQYSKLNRYNVISGMATLENFAVANLGGWIPMKDYNDNDINFRDL